MTFAELILVVGAVFGLSYLMRPLQRRLERYFLKLFRSDKPPQEGSVIDITDYSKEDGKPES